MSFKRAIWIGLVSTVVATPVLAEQTIPGAADISVQERDPGKAEADFKPGSSAHLAPIARTQRRWLKANEAALAEIDRTVASSPRSLPAHRKRADILIRMNRQKEAAAIAEHVVELEPARSEAYEIAAGIYARLDHREKAIEMIARWLELSPDHMDLDALVMRAGLRNPADYAGREADISSVLAVEPRNLGALYAKASLEFERGDFAAAVQTYQKISRLVETFLPSMTKIDGVGAFRQTPPTVRRDPRTLNLLAFALYRAGELQEAEKTFNEARRNSNDGMTLNSLCWGKVTFDIALELAMEECEDALDSMPDAPTILDSRGMVFLRMGNLGQARADFDRALWQFPEQANSLFARAIVRARQGEIEAARADAKAAQELWPHAYETFERWGFDIPEILAPEQAPFGMSTNDR